MAKRNKQNKGNKRRKNSQSQGNLSDFLNKEWRKDPTSGEFNLSDEGKKALHSSITPLIDKLKITSIFKLGNVAEAILSWLDKIPGPIMEIAVIALGGQLAVAGFFGARILSVIFIRLAENGTKGELITLLRKGKAPSKEQFVNAITKDLLNFEIFTIKDFEDKPDSFISSLTTGQLDHYTGLLMAIEDAKKTDDSRLDSLDGRSFRLGPAMRKLEGEHAATLRSMLKENVSFEEARKNPIDNGQQIFVLALHNWDPSLGPYNAALYLADWFDFAVNLEEVKQEWKEAELIHRGQIIPSLLGVVFGIIAGVVLLVYPIASTIVIFIIASAAFTGCLVIAPYIPH